MASRVQDLRKSWVWFDAFDDLLVGEPAEGTLGGQISRQRGYATLLDDALAGRGPLTLPWPAGGGLFNNFWFHYLDDRTPEEVGGREAWRHFIPLRRGYPVRPEGQAGDVSGPVVEVKESPAQRLLVEGYLYPHGVGVAITAHLLGDVELAAAVDLAIGALRSARLRLGEGSPDGPWLRLPLLAHQLLERLRQQLGHPERKLRIEVQTVATIVRAEVDDELLTVQPDGLVHRALDGLAADNPSWRDTPARPLDAHQLETRLGPENHLLYGLDRGRAVWYPNSFDPGHQGGSTLGCYHRNLTQLTLQVESLLALVTLADQHLTAHGTLPSARLADAVKLAAYLLGRLYSGQGTYRSASAAAQIEAGGRKLKVDEVRRRLGVGGPLYR